MVKKTKLWRKTLSDGESTKVAAEALRAKSISKPTFTEDHKGETEPEIYPKQFAKVKFAPSKTKAEHFLIKNLPIKRPHADQTEIFDLWAEEAEEKTLNKPQNSHIPAIINPHPGQSYRPEAAYHEDVLEKVIEEEYVKELDEKRHQEIINGFTVVENDPSPVESEDDEAVNYGTNPPVRVKYLTNTEKNIKERGRLKEKLKKLEANDKKSKKQFEQIPLILRQMENLERKYKNLRNEEGIRKKMKVELESQGEIVPRIRMGKYRYHKPDTVADIEPAEVLRRMSVKGNPVEERLDSFIRRKMVDLSTPRDQKKVVIKDNSNNEREKEFHEARARARQQKESGIIPLLK